MSDGAIVKTPWHLWLIGALSLIWNGWSLIFTVGTLMRGEPLEVSLGIWLVGAAIGVTGAIFLLMKSRVSASLLAAAFVAILLSLLAPLFLNSDAGEHLVMTGVIIAFYGLAAGLPYLYARRMAKKGVLR